MIALLCILSSIESLDLLLSISFLRFSAKEQKRLIVFLISAIAFDSICIVVDIGFCCLWRFGV